MCQFTRLFNTSLLYIVNVWKFQGQYQGFLVADSEVIRCKELTNGVKAVDAKAGWASVSYVDLFQVVVQGVGQYELHCDHMRLV